MATSLQWISCSYLYGQLAFGQVFDEFGDEGARARGRVENFHVLVAQRLPKCWKVRCVGGFDHKAHDLVGGVDDAQAVGGLGVVGAVKVFVERL